MDERSFFTVNAVQAKGLKVYYKGVSGKAVLMVYFLF
jgi:hypothetical protein